jgi:hypothetical protein
MDPYPSVRRQFRLTDLLVVVAVVCILVGLFLPGISRVRVPSAYSQCCNNVKQIVLAIHSYTDYFKGALPPESSAPRDDAWADKKGNTYPQSLFFTILPFIEGDALYRAGMEPSTNGRTWMGQYTIGSATSPIYSHGFFRVYVCPADPTNSPQQTTPSGWVGGSYAANYQVFGTENWAPKYKLVDIPDGTNNTVLIAERFAYFPGPAGRFTDPAGAAQQAGNLWAWPANCGTSPPTAYTTPVPQNAAIFAYGNLRNAPAYGYGPAVFSTPQIGIDPTHADFRLVQSGHESVVLVAMADGSVRGVAASVSQPTWQSAVLPADGTPLGTDW